MKAIRIGKNNLSKIQQLLDQVNDRAHAYTFFDAGHVLTVAESAEQQLADWHLPASYRIGAKLRAVSASPIKGYRGTRIATAIHLERRTLGWYLVEVSREELHSREGGERQYSLTRQQDVYSTAAHRKQWSLVSEQVKEEWGES